MAYAVSKKYEEFLKTFDSPNTIKVMKSLNAIGEHDYDNCTPIDLQQIILDMKPNSLKSITTVIYAMGLYARHLNNDEMYHMVKGLDRSMIWELARPRAKRKFISHSDFKRVVKEIELYEEHNGFYISTLFRSVYEGIYNDDMSVVKNLRASDVTERIVSLNPDNRKECFCYVPERLVADLVKLGKLDIWQRNNRYGTCNIKIQGVYKDSCFKVENRKGSQEYSYRFTYYRILRKVAKDYVGYGLLPLQLFVSGIMHRIKIQLNENRINLEEAFADNNKSRLVGSIIAEELERGNYAVTVRNFREMVKGHIDVFDD